ncbi:putative hydrolase of the HAD superfamily [Mycetocola sp. BIGb0189]|uniref:HAD family hydrolase n=1 Tax=Mycetocola sp. BIGb0189 TaxID=2940604 RepID=UPI002168D3E7|nr:HAD family phosphatase [Mycetocola sp. BIGb0189]MCS4274962.1 putative hydrolase of the HAD superfamily [Mycetocola sp. BIGb0189]
MTTHLLVDYGEVICVAQPALAAAGMAALVGMAPGDFHERYWRFREEYDRGQHAHEYWAEVLGRPASAEELAELRRLDLAGNIHLNFDTLEALRDAHRRGARLTLLSNAPQDLADAVSRFAAMREIFSLMLFSCELRMVKPGTQIFETALAVTETTPRETLFIDDRHDNIETANTLGLQTHHFTGADRLDADLAGIDFGQVRGERRPWPLSILRNRPSPS